MDLLTTREAAELAGVGTSAVKRWADAGVLPCVKTAGGHRRFERAAVERLMRNGHASTGQDTIGEWLEVMLAKRAGRDLEAMLLDERLERGSWYAVADFLGGVLGGLGERWARGTITVLEEHVASERMARALARVAGAIPLAGTAPVALLIAASGDEHTLGLSLVELCLREVGWQPRWGGRGTPERDVVAAIERGDVKLVAVSASAISTDRRALARQLASLGRACEAHDVRLVIGGRGAWPARTALAARFEDFASFHHAITLRGGAR